MAGSLALARRRNSSGGGKVRRSSSKADRLVSEDKDTTALLWTGHINSIARTSALGIYDRASAVVNADRGLGGYLRAARFSDAGCIGDASSSGKRRTSALRTSQASVSMVKFRA